MIMAKSEFANMTPEERRENGRKGGLASVKARREKKAMKDNLASLLSMSLKSGKIADVDTIKNFAALNGKNVTVQDAILIKQVQKAMKGDTKAAEFIRDLSGNKPDSSLDIKSNGQIVIIDDIE
jgi:hypothetical protein